MDIQPIPEHVYEAFQIVADQVYGYALPHYRSDRRYSQNAMNMLQKIANDHELLLAQILGMIADERRKKQ